MSIERRACVSPAPHVTKRLFAVIVLLTGLFCVFGGYMLGRMSRTEPKRGNDILTHNLTILADNLYKKSKRIVPKVIHHYSENIQTRLLDIFNCSSQFCGTVDKYNLSDFVKNSINYQVGKLMKSFQNASLYLDNLS